MKRALLLTWSPVVDDPRVRRMGDALAAHGWEVRAIGLGGGLAAAPSWPVASIAEPTVVDHEKPFPLERAVGHAAGAALASAGRQLAKRRSALAGPVSILGQKLQEEQTPLRNLAARSAGLTTRKIKAMRQDAESKRLENYWRYSALLEPMRQEALRQHGASLVIANDWQTLPIAAETAAANGGVYVYDSHELAVEQFAHDPSWKRFTQPMIRAVERRYAPGAAVTTAVSASIADHLTRQYGLSPPASVLRNTPIYQPVEYRQSGDSLRVLYHGAVAPGRGLEEAIDSLAMWKPHLSLHIRGPADTAYLEALEARAATLNLEDRVHFLPPVPFDDLINAASAFDIGLMALPDLSLHKRYALPNKVFEYLMAGLALAVSDLPEMAHIVKETGAGFTFRGTAPDAIAGALNNITPDMVNQKRRAALDAAKHHHWEADAGPIIAAYEEAFARRNKDQTSSSSP